MTPLLQAFLGGGGGAGVMVGLIYILLNYRMKRDTLWFQSSETSQKNLERQCNSCLRQLGAQRRRLNTLLHALDTICDTAENGTVRVSDLRGAVWAARQEPEMMEDDETR